MPGKIIASETTQQNAAKAEEQKQPANASAAAVVKTKEETPKNGGGSAGNLTPEQLEANVRSFVTPESVQLLTKRTIREKLAERLNLPIETINNYKDAINTIVETVVAEITEAEPEQPATSVERVKRKAAEAEPNRSPAVKKAKTEKEENENSEGDDGEQESSEEEDGEDSESEEETPRRRPKAKAKGVKAMQGKLMTKNAFLETAKAYDCRIGDLEFKLDPRKFSTGSCGWYFGGKFPFVIGDKEVTCSIGLNCTVVGSKTWTEGKKK